MSFSSGPSCSTTSSRRSRRPRSQPEEPNLASPLLPDSAVPKAVAITLAPDKPPVTVTSAPRPRKPVETAIYDVRSGDNVPGIAAALGVGAGDLIKLNNLDSTELYPGRKLTYPRESEPPPLKAMPILSIAANTPASKPESFSAVTTAKENTPPVKLKDNPAVTSADQPPGAKTAHKDGSSGGATKPAADSPSESSKTTKTASKSDKPSKSESSAKTASKTEKPSKDSAARRSHTVGRNETLYAIARKYGVKVDALQKLNGIKDPTMLRDGMKLTIPPKS